jgi:hypothetical protein
MEGGSATTAQRTVCFDETNKHDSARQAPIEGAKDWLALRLLTSTGLQRLIPSHGGVNGHHIDYDTPVSTHMH